MIGNTNVTVVLFINDENDLLLRFEAVVIFLMSYNVDGTACCFPLAENY